eukprot:GHVS01044031.1.p1 GENE.GHVS01044031.1~~GHVS01044031.1.p1  ORF type:complete len:882 (-),score=157.43 GHVS01044031.1:139-2676(-)
MPPVSPLSAISLRPFRGVSYPIRQGPKEEEARFVFELPYHPQPPAELPCSHENQRLPEIHPPLPPPSPTAAHCYHRQPLFAPPPPPHRLLPSLAVQANQHSHHNHHSRCGWPGEGVNEGVRYLLEQHSKAQDGAHERDARTCEQPHCAQTLPNVVASPSMCTDRSSRRCVQRHTEEILSENKHNKSSPSPSSFLQPLRFSKQNFPDGGGVFSSRTSLPDQESLSPFDYLNVLHGYETPAEVLGCWIEGSNISSTSPLRSPIVPSSPCWYAPDCLALSLPSSRRHVPHPRLQPDMSGAANSCCPTFPTNCLSPLSKTLRDFADEQEQFVNSSEAGMVSESFSSCATSSLVKLLVGNPSAYSPMDQQHLPQPTLPEQKEIQQQQQLSTAIAAPNGNHGVFGSLSGVVEVPPLQAASLGGPHSPCGCVSRIHSGSRSESLSHLSTSRRTASARHSFSSAPSSTPSPPSSPLLDPDLQSSPLMLCQMDSQMRHNNNSPDKVTALLELLLVVLRNKEAEAPDAIGQFLLSTQTSRLLYAIRSKNDAAVNASLVYQPVTSPVTSSPQSRIASWQFLQGLPPDILISVAKALLSQLKQEKLATSILCVAPPVDHLSPMPAAESNSTPPPTTSAHHLHHQRSPSGGPPSPLATTHGEVTNWPLSFSNSANFNPIIGDERQTVRRTITTTVPPPLDSIETAANSTLLCSPSTTLAESCLPPDCLGLPGPTQCSFPHNLAVPDLRPFASINSSTHLEQTVPSAEQGDISPKRPDVSSRPISPPRSPPAPPQPNASISTMTSPRSLTPPSSKAAASTPRTITLYTKCPQSRPSASPHHAARRSPSSFLTLQSPSIQ